MRGRSGDDIRRFADVKAEYKNAYEETRVYFGAVIYEAYLALTVYDSL